MAKHENKAQVIHFPYKMPKDRLLLYIIISIQIVGFAILFFRK